MSRVEASTCESACELSTAVYYEPSHEMFDGFEVFAFQSLGRVPLTHFAGSSDNHDARKSEQRCEDPPADETLDEPYHKCQWVAAYRKGEVTNKRTLYVAFKGTSNALDILLDLSFMDVVTRRGCRMHSGIFCGVQDELLSVIEVIQFARAHLKTSRVVLCGHSLGGGYATAALCEYLSERDSSNDPLPQWDQNIHAEAITFGAPLILRSPTPRARVQAPNNIKITNIINNYDIIPRMFALPTSALTGLLEEAPKIMGGFMFQQIASMALKNSGLTSAKITETFHQIRLGYRAVGTFVFMNTDTGCNTQPGYFPLNGTYSVIKERGFTPANPDAEAMLQYFPSIDVGSPCAKALREDKGSFIMKSLEDHSMAAYASGIRCLAQNPNPWAIAMISSKRYHAVVSPPSECSLTSPPPPGAMPKRVPNTPWCIVSRVSSEKLLIETYSKGSTVCSWSETLHPGCTVIIQGVKAPGDSVKILNINKTTVCDIVLPSKSVPSSTYAHLAIEYSGVLGYVCWESVMEESSEDEKKNSFFSFKTSPKTYVERDNKCLYPIGVAAGGSNESAALHNHKLSYFLAGVSDATWTLSDVLGTGCPEDKREKSDKAPTCRGCLVATFGSRVRRQHCSRCGLSFCSSCLVGKTHFLKAYAFLSVPICSKCTRDLSKNRQLFINRSENAANLASLHLLLIGRKKFLSVADSKLVFSFLENT